MRISEQGARNRIARHGSLSAEEIAVEMREQARIVMSRYLPVGSADAPTGVSPAPSASDLRSLLTPQGVDFVEGAFAALLRRPPNAEERAHYVAQLVSGERTKIDILGDLRYSPAGRAAGVAISGLFTRYALTRCYRLPGIGRLLRILVIVARTPRLARQIQQLEQTVHADRQVQAELLSSVALAQGSVEAIQQPIGRLQLDLAKISASAESHFEHIESRLAAPLVESWAEPLLALAERVDEQLRRTQLLEKQTPQIVAVATVLRELRAEYGWSEDGPSAFAARFAALLRDAIQRAMQADETAQRNRVDLLDQSRRLGLIMADVRKRLDRPFTHEEGVRFEEEDDHRLDPLYVAFEDRFRGSRSDIRQRQRIHLPLLHEAGAGSLERPIVDLGAGRGEWLELLRDQGLHATGVDLNRSMVKLCQDLGLACVQNDAISYLRELPDDSIGAITGFHIIEHLPFKAFVALLDESRRTLMPGGMILFETPNPANVLVGSRLFYLDPTHRNPMPGEMTAMMAEARGFVQVEIRELFPMAAHFQARDEVLARQLDRLFHGPQDYALVARKA